MQAKETCIWNIRQKSILTAPMPRNIWVPEGQIMYLAHILILLDHYSKSSYNRVRAAYHASIMEDMEIVV